MQFCDIRITKQPLDWAFLSFSLTEGAVVDFFGVVRTIENDRLIDGIEYEAFEAMAERQLALIADAYGAVGRPEEGLKRLEEATRLIAGAGEHYAASTVYRVRGELLMSLGHDRKGAASLQQALTIARRQGARVLQLRAALSLAQRRRAQGAPGAERDLIGALLSQEIESLDAPAFREARTLASRVCG